MIQPTVYPHFTPTKPDLSMYEIRSCDPTQPCDLNTKEWTWTLKDQVEQILADASTDKPKANI